MLALDLLHRQLPYRVLFGRKMPLIVEVMKSDDDTGEEREETAPEEDTNVQDATNDYETEDEDGGIGTEQDASEALVHEPALYDGKNGVEI